MLIAGIADAMSAKKWKNKNLLEAVGKDNPSVITKWLSGTHNFTIETLVELEYALDVKLLELNEQKNMPVTVYHIKSVELFDFSLNGPEGSLPEKQEFKFDIKSRTSVQLQYQQPVELCLRILRELFTPLGLFCKTLYYCVLAKEALLF